MLIGLIKVANQKVRWGSQRVELCPSLLGIKFYLINEIKKHPDPYKKYRSGSVDLDLNS